MQVRGETSKSKKQSSWHLRTLGHLGYQCPRFRKRTRRVLLLLIYLELLRSAVYRAGPRRSLSAQQTGRWVEGVEEAGQNRIKGSRTISTHINFFKPYKL